MISSFIPDHILYTCGMDHLKDVLITAANPLLEPCRISLKMKMPNKFLYFFMLISKHGNKLVFALLIQVRQETLGLLLLL